MAAETILGNEVHEGKHVVLVAEDEIIIRFDITEALRQLGCQVIEAGNADEAIDALRSTARIDLVVTDVQMPGERNGLDVARVVKEVRPGVKVVVMSGHLAPSEEHEHLMDLFVLKPMPTEHLAKTIVKLMRPDAAERDGR